MSAEVSQTSSAGFVERIEQKYSLDVLRTLLTDRTTQGNILWADDEYEVLGEGYQFNDEIALVSITGVNSGVIKPRTAKEMERQSQRTKSHAEVFTPSWLCNQMNNYLDEDWFGRKSVFTAEDAQSWEPTEEPIEFPRKKGRGWQAYVDSPRLEITCGEAPFICSRYDTVSGEPLPVPKRIGFLDRKLRVVSEKTRTRKDWGKWALRALKATYGYEYQGDNLLIARVNCLEAYVEYCIERWGERPNDGEIAQAAKVVSWNLWQMDGRTCAIPSGEPAAAVQPPLFELAKPEPEQMSMLDLLNDWAEPKREESAGESVPLCVIYDWEASEPVVFASLKSKEQQMKKFYAVIGNPPYQEETEGNQRKTPIYNFFMDEAYRVSERTELVTPARFLFNAGQTPKEWNRKMLADEHLKVVQYTADANEMFTGPEIKGGIAVTYRDSTQSHKPIGVFIPFAEMEGVLSKVRATDPSYLSDLVTGAVPYSFTEAAKNDHPEFVDDMGSSFDLRTNALDKLNGKLFADSPSDNYDYAGVYGLLKKRRALLWIRREYINAPNNFSSYKVLIAKAIGGGTYGEPIGETLVAAKGVGHTQSFVSIGSFDTEQEAYALSAYLRTKFVRSLLGLLKVTQDVTPRVWSFVPLQDFTPNSDIDWSKSIPEIDQQLYAKYGLDEDEINFIETHVKEMS